MKFICENCKAKYQIGDDKIAGRSVRMKCRRCGHLIQLSAGATAEAGHEHSDLAPVESASATSMSLADLLGAKPEDALDDVPTRAMSVEQRIAAGAAAQKPQPAPAAPAAHAPAAAPAPTAPVAPAAPVAPVAARPLAAAAPARPASTLGAPAPRVGAAAPAARPAGGVAGSFQKSVTGAAAAALAPQTPPPAGTAGHVPHGEDWYVGVGGVPLGPVRLAVIREKAQAGVVHPNSLVWREGFDEWQPLKNFPELLTIVEEAQAGRHVPPRPPSAIPPPPTAARPAPGVPARPGGITAPAPGLRPPGAPAGYQPKVTAIGVGIPAAKVPLASSATQTGPLSGSPATMPAPVPPPAAPAGMRPSPTGVPRTSSLPTPAPKPAHEVTRPSAPTPAPAAAKPDLSSTLASPEAAPRASAPAPAAARVSAPAISSPAVSGSRPAGLPPDPFADVALPPGRAATPEPAPSGDLFGLAAAPAPAPTPAPAPAPVVPVPPAADVAPASRTAAAAAPAAAVAAAPALDVMRDPFAAPAAPVESASAAAAAALVGRASVVPSSTQRLSEPPAIEEKLTLPVRQGLHPLAYAFIAMAAAFGAVGAFLLLSPKPQQPIVIVQQAPGGSGTAATPSGTPTETAPTPTSTADVAASGDPTSGPKTGGGPWPKASTTASSGPTSTVDPSGFNQQVPGPAATPTGTTADSNLGQLSAGEIQGVVASNQARIRKRCWQPALDSAGPNASGNARVKGHIVIGPSGAVQSASASGAEKDYPGLSSCIAGQMQGWKFPPSGGTTPVDVPFVFAGQ
ncbi:MAG: zinc-ribbon domain-containing protein [Polyangiaceae bacterium]|nr:zinc-ribbon domain-containing protein [Polyangiaceae bacterium]